MLGFSILELTSENTKSVDDSWLLQAIIVSGNEDAKQSVGIMVSEKYDIL